MAERILKPISEMTPEEMRLELELLRSLRHIAIRDARKRGAGGKRTQTALLLASGPLDFLNP